MTPLDFRLLLVKYRKDDCTDEERKIVETWYGQLDEGQLSELDGHGKNLLEEKIWLRIAARTKPAAIRPVYFRPAGLRWLGVAASVVAVMAVSFYVFKFQPPKNWQNAGINTAETVRESGLVAYSNQGTAIREITLPDGSTVSLYPASELTHGKEFNRAVREVTLTGEAFFRVARNAGKPFFVRTRDITTKVLGTSFNVKAYPSQKNSTVSVRTGRVEVSNHTGIRTETVVLTPNQRIVFVASAGLLKKEIAQKPESLAGRHMDFEERPVQEVFAALEETYGVEIDYDRKAMENCTVTVSFSSESLAERMDLLCKILGATYRNDNAVLSVLGSGCGGK